MKSNQLELIMLKFLVKNFPTKRIKDKTKFKRAISIDGDNYFIRDEKNKFTLIVKLDNILYKVFGVSDKLNKNVLETFLNLKK